MTDNFYNLKIDVNTELDKYWSQWIKTEDLVINIITGTTLSQEGYIIFFEIIKKIKDKLFQYFFSPKLFDELKKRITRTEMDKSLNESKLFTRIILVSIYKITESILNHFSFMMQFWTDFKIDNYNITMESTPSIIDIAGVIQDCISYFIEREDELFDQTDFLSKYGSLNEVVEYEIADYYIEINTQPIIHKKDDPFDVYRKSQIELKIMEILNPHLNELITPLSLPTKSIFSFDDFSRYLESLEIEFVTPIEKKIVNKITPDFNKRILSNVISSEPKSPFKNIAEYLEKLEKQYLSPFHHIYKKLYEIQDLFLQYNRVIYDPEIPTKFSVEFLLKLQNIIEKPSKRFI